MRAKLFFAVLALHLAGRALARGQVVFKDATEASGLPLMNSARLCFADLNGDGRADVIARDGDRYRVFVNKVDASSRLGLRYVEISQPELPSPIGGDLLTFADLDSDGLADAIFTRYLDTKNPKFVAPTTQPTSTCWLKGRGDGTFESPQLIDAATRGTTACIAVGDANCDGLPDMALGNWYDRYGETNSAYPTDLLLQTTEHRFVRSPLPEDGVAFDEEHDAGSRPTYGLMFVRLDESPVPSILQLSYGRRANRLYQPVGGMKYEDRAPALHLDGDEIRHGKYPRWLKEVGKTNKALDREDEKPFRSHGNTFDAAVGDVDGDGRFDLFVSEITHAWAGDSSDRSRFLLQRDHEFVYDPRLSVDRDGTNHENHLLPTPADEARGRSGLTTAATRPRHPNWNQGDLFCALADLDNDGRLDLILCSSDYPDPPPHENRLRIYQQQMDGSFLDVTPASGIDHLGAQQISLADVDGDGDLDILVGQSFNRFTKEMIEQRTPPGPVARLFLNQADGSRKSIELRLVGNPSRGVTRSAFNAIVRLTATVDGRKVTQLRQLIGPGGHNGKVGDQVVHFGLGSAGLVDEIRVCWPAPNVPDTVLKEVKAGIHTVQLE